MYFTVCHYDLWTVVEEDREGWTHINPASGYLTVETPSSAQPATLMFGNFRDVWIVVFRSTTTGTATGCTTSGIYPGSDLPIEGWMFTISGPGVTNAVAYTDSGGYAYFLVNRSGTYTVTEEDRTGWVHVSPLSGTTDVTVVSGDKPGSAPVRQLRAGEGLGLQVRRHPRERLVRPADGDDIPLEGWKFTLYLWDGDEWEYVAENYTDEFGYASFLIDRAGFYMIEEELQTGWMCIMPSMSGTTDFDLIGGQQMFLDRVRQLQAGQDIRLQVERPRRRRRMGRGRARPERLDRMVRVRVPALPERLRRHGRERLLRVHRAAERDLQGLGDTPRPAGSRPRSTPSTWTSSATPRSEVDFFNFELGCIWGYKYEDMNGNGDPGRRRHAAGGMDHIPVHHHGRHRDGRGPDERDHAHRDHHDRRERVLQLLRPRARHLCRAEAARTGWVATNDPSETVVMTSGASIRIHTFLNVELSTIWGYKFEDLDSERRVGQGRRRARDKGLDHLHDVGRRRDGLQHDDGLHRLLGVHRPDARRVVPHLGGAGRRLDTHHG